jgi:hypothetical protein
MVKYRSGTQWLNDWEVGWCCMWSAPCTRRRRARVSWLSLKTKVGGFSGLGLKTGSCSLVIWASKSPQRILGLGLKTKRAMVCWLRHKIDERRTARDASKSSGLFHLEASQARVSQFASKLVKERRWVVHVASSQRSCEDEVKDRLIDAMGYIGPFYPNFPIFIVLGPRGILVFWLGL